MPTEQDHISNMLARLLDKKRFHERQIQQIEDVVQSIRSIHAIFNSEYKPTEILTKTKTKAKSRVEIESYKTRDSIANKVVNFVMKQPAGTEIKVSELSKILNAKHVAIRSKLYNLVKKDVLTYESGIGFHKKESRPVGNLFPRNSELVYDSSDNSRRKDFNE